MPRTLRYLNESPRPKAGKCRLGLRGRLRTRCLNESPRPKAGKSQRQNGQGAAEQEASMKVPALRRGNTGATMASALKTSASMKVPALRRGNTWENAGMFPFVTGLNESPRPKAGKSGFARITSEETTAASMKVPARRWGNYRSSFKHFPFQQNLNESSRPKAGKFSPPNRMVDYSVTLMKVPDRRRGNKSIPKQPFKHLNTIDKPKHHASDTPSLRHVPGSRGDRQSLQRSLSPPPRPVRNRTRHSSAPLPRVASE